MIKQEWEKMIPLIMDIDMNMEFSKSQEKVIRELIC